MVLEDQLLVGILNTGGLGIGFYLMWKMNIDKIEKNTEVVSKNTEAIISLKEYIQGNLKR